MAKIVPVEPLPLPATREQMVAQRKVQVEPNLNDLVDMVHLVLYDDAEYKRLLHAVHHSQAVTGRLAFDDYKLAERVMDQAKEMDLVGITSENFGTIHSSLQVVLRRYGLSRSERRVTVGGQKVAPESGGVPAE
jgi:hypothetical protein